MNWIEIKSEKDLPKEGKYVVAKHNRGTWHDSDDQENVNTVVVKLMRGISLAERKAMKGTDKDYQERPPENNGVFSTTGLRSDTYKFADEHGNNIVPYRWNQFGPGSFFGQSITHWAAITPVQ